MPRIRCPRIGLPYLGRRARARGTFGTGIRNEMRIPENTSAQTQIWNV